MDVSAILTNHPELCSVFPPDCLPVNIHEFLKACFTMSDYTVGKLAWHEFRLLAWNTPFLDVRKEEVVARKHLLFMDYGLPREISRFRLSQDLLL